MNIGGLDLDYWNRPSDWTMGWRPDDFFKLPKKEQERIERAAERTENPMATAKRLVAESMEAE